MTEDEIRKQLAKLQDEGEQFREELEQMAAASVSSKKEVVLAKAWLWLYQNAVLKPAKDRKPVSVKVDKVEGEW